MIRISFKEDSINSTTGNGQFLLTNDGIDCGSYTIDPPPHDYNYFLSQLHSVNQYFVNVSYDTLGIFPDSEDKRILQNLTSFSLNRSF